jgi:Carboxypeptidase regulatory-like domain
MITTSRQAFKVYLRTAFFVLALLLPCCLNLSATTDTGGVSGRILDPRGAPVAGAHLKLLNFAGTPVAETNSNAHGTFVLEGIDPLSIARISACNIQGA